MVEQASEYGGVPGLHQPDPHELTGVEEARLERWTDPADPEDNVEAARARGHAIGGRGDKPRSGYVTP